MLVITGFLLVALAYYGITLQEVRIVQTIFQHKGICKVNKEGKPMPWKLRKVYRNKDHVVIILLIPDGISTSDLTFSPEGLASVIGVLEERFAAVVTVERDEDEMTIEIIKDRHSVLHDYTNYLSPSPSVTDGLREGER